MTRKSDQSFPDEANLTIDLEKICFIIMKAQEFDVKEGATDPEPGSNPTDDDDRSILEDYGDDPVLEELHSLISSLSIDEQVDLVALTWLGREDYTADDWDTVRADAADAHNERTAEYLCGTPLLADHLANGLAEFGLNCADYDEQHL